MNMTYIEKVVRSCKTEDQLITAIDWYINLKRLETPVNSLRSGRILKRRIEDQLEYINKLNGLKNKEEQS